MSVPSTDQIISDLVDKRRLRLMTIEAISRAFVDLYGAGPAETRDDHQSSIWYWVACEVRAAIDPLQEVRSLSLEQPRAIKPGDE